ncbi:dTDP-4-dehydrorhamnose reductase [Thalassospira lucentensis]|uniref:dTDP-4-dehydrorhamnose reductase n=1 Tax=Thalassospira lucentensis TaxID=168935 RepID=UPI00142E8DCB|nr:dTDP-4-dehydrorhamnose reductase [Thalassospira lucentensis]NIZ03309.1 dTDP-4-dehydrorhamnose reductase [Thalassospira lucentensis]
MIKVLVFGKNGQLARSLAWRSSAFAGLSIQFLDRNECDVAQSGNITKVVDLYRPDIIINATAYTGVDIAENEPELARRVNCDAVREMAENAARHSVPFIHISTDYVFDGEGKKPYRETDPVAPLGVYGATKLAGEEAIRAITNRHLILRTSWVYSPFGKNFVKTMLRLLGDQTHISVVDDQQGCPTSALDLATAILRIVPDIVRHGFDQFGTYHLVSGAEMTWCAFSSEIQAKAIEIFGAQWPGATCEIQAVTSDKFPTAARRPSYSVMAPEKFRATFGFGLPEFDQSLMAVLQNLAEGDAHA